MLVPSSLVQSSRRSSQVVMVLNKEGTWHMFLDFCPLKKLIIEENISIPIIDDLLDDLTSSHFFKLDLQSSYHQIHLKEKDIPKTSFCTNEGHHELLVTPFGLFNSLSTF